MPEKFAAKLTPQGALTGVFVSSVLLFMRADQVLPPTPNPPDLSALLCRAAKRHAAPITVSKMP